MCLCPYTCMLLACLSCSYCRVQDKNSMKLITTIMQNKKTFFKKTCCSCVSGFFFCFCFLIVTETINF